MKCSISQLIRTHNRNPDTSKSTGNPPTQTYTQYLNNTTRSQCPEDTSYYIQSRPLRSTKRKVMQSSRWMQTRRVFRISGANTNLLEANSCPSCHLATLYTYIYFLSFCTLRLYNYLLWLPKASYWGWWGDAKEAFEWTIVLVFHGCSKKKQFSKQLQSGSVRNVNTLPYRTWEEPGVQSENQLDMAIFESCSSMQSQPLLKLHV